MYNFFVTAQENAWERTSYSYDRSRFLEYTNEEIAASFKELTQDQLNAIKSYPCLFAYEGYDSDVRVGYLREIKVRNRNLLIEFEIRQDITPIPFADIEKICPLLDIRHWEMGRTHWAIKDENLIERLVTASIIPAGTQTASISESRPTPEHHQSPKATSVQEFINQILSIEKNQDSEIFYRGHANKEKYKLAPSLFRKDPGGNYLYLENEHILYRELIVSNSSDFASDVYTLDRLIRMQHYSLPTRLLDITSNPLIALYFSCKDEIESPGEVVIFSIQTDKIKYFDSDVASCIANLARLPQKEKEAINFELDHFNNQRPVHRLIHFIREEKSFFEPVIKSEDLRTIICVKGKMSNDRISSQSGAFLLFGLDAVLEETGNQQISLNRIAIENKKHILAELDLLNINEKTVFPHIENSAKYVAEKYKLKIRSEVTNTIG